MLLELSLVEQHHRKLKQPHGILETTGRFRLLGSQSARRHFANLILGDSQELL